MNAEQDLALRFIGPSAASWSSPHFNGESIDQVIRLTQNFQGILQTSTLEGASANASHTGEVPPPSCLQIDKGKWNWRTSRRSKMIGECSLFMHMSLLRKGLRIVNRPRASSFYRHRNDSPSDPSPRTPHRPAQRQCPTVVCWPRHSPHRVRAHLQPASTRPRIWR